MFERRRRNWDLSGTKKPVREEHSTHGISWGRENWQAKDHLSEPANERELEHGWEEADEEIALEPDRENFSQHPPKGQLPLAFSEQHTVKNETFHKTSPFYPRLQKKPDFHEQNKKLTIYMDKELVKTMERLKKERYISSYSWFISEAVKYYLTRISH